MSDSIEQDWTAIYNERFGSGITRRNVAIGIPIVQNYTLPKKLYQDGTIDPPKVVKARLAQDREVESYIEEGHSPPGNSAFAAVWANPNFRGNGTYEQEQHKYRPHFELPEFDNGVAPAQPPQASKMYPIEVRRRIYN